MNDFGSVEVLEGLGYFIDDIADVHILEDVFSDDVVQVGLHELEYQVNISVVLRLDGFKQPDYVRVLDLPQDLDLSISALSVSGVLEGVEYFFEGQNLFA